MEIYGRARQATADDIMWCMRFTCWMTMATISNSEYVILIAFPLQDWLHRHASVCCTYFAFLVVSY